MTTKEENGWNRRKVDFDKIHGDNEEAFSFLVNALGLQSGMTIGDFMCGYGSLSRKVLEHCVKEGHFVRIILSDAYQEQLDRTHIYLAPYEQQGFVIQRHKQDICSLSLESKIDKAIIKLGLHELRKEQQLSALVNVFDVLKPQGEIYLWEFLGKTEELTKYFRKVVKEKDRLAGYQSLVENRYFAHEDEIVANLRSAGFTDILTVYEGIFLYETATISEADFSGDKEKLQSWNNYLRQNLPEHIKRAINFTERGESISMSFTKKIIKAKKP